jgi:hypothetical protein
MVQHKSYAVLTIGEIAEEVGISCCSCQTILIKNMGMRFVSFKFIVHLLTQEQEEKGMSLL